MAKIIDINNKGLILEPSDQAEQIELFKEFDKHLQGEEDWYGPSRRSNSRIKILKTFAEHTTIQHSEMFESDNFRTIVPLPEIRK